MGGGTDDGAEVLAPSTEVEVAEQIMQRLEIRITCRRSELLLV